MKQSWLSFLAGIVVSILAFVGLGFANNSGLAPWAVEPIARLSIPELVNLVKDELRESSRLQSESGDDALFYTKSLELTLEYSIEEVNEANASGEAEVGVFVVGGGGMFGLTRGEARTITLLFETEVSAEVQGWLSSRAERAVVERALAEAIPGLVSPPASDDRNGPDGSGIVQIPCRQFPTFNGIDFVEFCNNPPIPDTPPGLAHNWREYFSQVNPRVLDLDFRSEIVSICNADENKPFTFEGVSGVCANGSPAIVTVTDGSGWAIPIESLANTGN